MAAMIEETSTITAKGQTTVPKAVRQTLGSTTGEKSPYRIEKGRVTGPQSGGRASRSNTCRVSRPDREGHRGRPQRSRPQRHRFFPRVSLEFAPLYIQGLTYWAPAVSSSPMRSLDFGTRLRCHGPVCSNPAIAKLFASRPSWPMRIPTSILKLQDGATSSPLSPLATV
jgi:hypothetical protein